MKWTTFKLGGVSLTHVQQDDNSNQCVAASLAMVCKNAGYSGHQFGEGAIFSQGMKAMKANNNDNWEEGITAKKFVTDYGIRPNAVAELLTNYGFSNVNEVRAANGAQNVVDAINGMSNGDSAILACGVDQLHAFAAFKINNVSYVLNPMPADDSYRGCCYLNNANVVELHDGGVFFREPDFGSPSFRSVDICYSIPSQAYVGTLKRWYFG